MSKRSYNTILFDLDDTLLGNNMEQFIPRYFALLGEYAQPLFANSRLFLKALLLGTQAMIAAADSELTNREVFWQTFAERTGLDARETEAFFDRFYRERFPSLQPATEARPVAVKLVRHCLEQGCKVVVATNPLFPRRAIEQRLAWAGLPVTEFAFALVTTYDNMRATKPHQAYYRQILADVGVDAAGTLMVGDNWENDIKPAIALGMDAYWISPESAVPPDAALVAGHGTLDDLYRWLVDP